MSGPKIVVVVFMLTIVLDAMPQCPRKHWPVPNEATNIRNRIGCPMFKPAANTNALLRSNVPDTYLPSPISLIDDFPACITSPVLNKCEKDEFSEFLVKPFDFGGGIISGINYWFIIDKYDSDLHIDEEYYSYCKEAIEEFCDETFTCVTDDIAVTKNDRIIDLCVEIN